MESTGDISPEHLQRQQPSPIKMFSKPGTPPSFARLLHNHLIQSSDIQFPAKLCSMEATSTECLSEVRSLLRCPFKIAAARSLQGNEAQMFIDFLDRVSGLRATPLGLTTERSGHRFSSSHLLTTYFAGGVSCCSQKSANSVASYPPGMFFKRRYT